MRAIRSVFWLTAGLACAGCVEADADTRGGAPSSRPHAAETQGAAVLSASASTSGSASPPEARPTPPSIAEVLAAIPEDPPPPHIIKGTHYFVSNELTPEAFRLQAEGRGGIYLGVGAEQNYLFAGWARPEVLIVADFDQWVVDVHFIHGVLMKDAPDPDTFVALWSRAQRHRARALITRAVADRETRQRILDVHDVTHRGVFAKLMNQQVAYRGRNIPTWLTDRAQYDHVAGLYRSGRARALRGDFTGRVSLEAIAAAARQLELPVRTLYLSNVEDYFYYSSGLGRNLLAQPIDDRSIVLRTWAVKGTKYMYVAQSASDFQRWLTTPGIDHRLDIQKGTTIRKTPEGRFIGGPP